MLRRFARRLPNVSSLARGFTTAATPTPTPAISGRAFQLDYLPYEAVKAKHTQFASLPLQYLRVHAHRRQATLHFLHASDAAAFRNSLLFRAWTKRGTELSPVALDKTAELSAKIPAAILCYGLMRSVKLTLAPSAVMEQAVNQLKRRGKTEKVVERYTPEARYAIGHYRSIEDAWEAYDACMRGAIPRITAYEFVDPAEYREERNVDGKFTELRRPVRTPMLASLPSPRRLVFEGFPYHTNLRDIEFALNLGPIVEEITLDIENERANITFLSAMSVQEFARKHPNNEVEINRTMVKFSPCPWPAPSPQLVSATRLGATRTLLLSGFEVKDLNKRTNEVEVHFRQILGEHVVDVLLDSGFRSSANVTFSSIEAASRALLALPQVYADHVLSFENLQVKYIPDGHNLGVIDTSAYLYEDLFEDEYEYDDRGSMTPATGTTATTTTTTTTTPDAEEGGDLEFLSSIMSGGPLPDSSSSSSSSTPPKKRSTKEDDLGNWRHHPESLL